MIELKNVSKKYNDLEILKNFNMELDENQITCLFGPSGVGKTTIANIIAHIVPIDQGIIMGTEKSLFSYVFQEPRLLDWCNVYENIDFVLRDVYDKETRDKITKNYIDMVDLTEFSNYKISNLSGGMAQRVSLARAFAYPSDILIMDEPFKGLDIKLKHEMIEAFKKLWDTSKRTVMFITHDVEEAVLLSNIIYIIKNRPVEISEKIIINKNSDINHIRKKLMEC